MNNEERYVYSVRERTTGKYVNKTGEYVDPIHMMIYMNKGPARSFITRQKKLENYYRKFNPNDLEVVTFRLTEVNAKVW